MFCFRKNKFFSRFETYYALLLESFYIKNLPEILFVCIELWLTFEPQIHSTRFTLNVLFIIVKPDLCVKLFNFCLTGYSLFDLKFIMFCPKFCRNSCIVFLEKGHPD